MHLSMLHLICTGRVECYKVDSAGLIEGGDEGAVHLPVIEISNAARPLCFPQAGPGNLSKRGPPCTDLCVALPCGMAYALRSREISLAGRQKHQGER